MAFGGGGGGGFSFGSNNNTQQSTGFGGFGNNPPTTSNTGFGTSLNTSGGGFGTSTNASNPFGGSTFGSNTGTAFNSSTSNPTSLFGANKPSTGFGSATTTGSSLFGNNNAASASTGFGGGFGSNTNSNAFNSNTTTQSGGFGGFGGAKPAFGSGPSGSTLFGQGGAGTTGGFGSNNSPFGGTGTGTALNQNVPPAPGTADPPFNPTDEQESGSSAKTRYQSITMQPSYQKYSFEELRLADYNAGRRFGNGSGQAGAFGSNTFGGFGSNTNTGFAGGSGGGSNPFGSSTTANNNTSFGGGLSGFGSTAAKPTGGLFGPQTSATTSGGLFGTTNNSPGFGQTNTGTGFGPSAGGGLFGNNSAQPKPSLFGPSNTATTSGGFSFGPGTATSGSGGGLFGQNTNTNSPAFGNTGTQQAGGGLFGNLNTNTMNTTQNKGIFGNSGTGFGTNPATQTQPSGGLFGQPAASNTSGGLFGPQNTTQNNPSGGLFGNTNTNVGGGLFSNPPQQNKSNLFGNANSGGLFGNQNATQPQGNSLFNSNTTSGGLFGNQTNANKPSLFNTSLSTNQPSNNLFGTSNTGGGLFNNSQGGFGNSQQQQQDGPRLASQLEGSPYTKSSIWTGLPESAPSNPPPLLTPLSASSRLKDSSMKPAVLRNHFAKFQTPNKGGRAGYGFSYSTYGTPSSTAGSPASGLRSSMYNRDSLNGGGFSKGLHKSFSSSMLRPQYADAENVVSPGAFTPHVSRYSSGSMRRLTVDRNIRTDLFSPTYPALPPPAEPATTGATNTSSINGEAPSEPNKLKKRVSFNNEVSSDTNSGTLNGDTGALIRTEVDDEPPLSNGAKDRQPEMEQVRGGRELAVVPEDRESDDIVSNMRLPTDVQAKPDPIPGDYWMTPTRAEMSKMPRSQLQRFSKFEVGRKGCGWVVFDEPVDLTNINLDDVFDKLVEIRLRSITVYPDPGTKPSVGKGLNVPSTLHIENSWPRSRNRPSSATAGPVYDKHVARLKRMPSTTFVGYDAPSGIWTFNVPHYTRYGLDYDDNDEDMDKISDLSSSMEEQDIQLPTTDDSLMYTDQEDTGLSQDDDTFAFKQKMVPGGFDKRGVVDDVHSDEDIRRNLSSDSEDEVEMAGKFPEPAPPVLFSPRKSFRAPGTPGKPLLDLDGDWADQLQRTISPRKQNRDNLRDLQGKALLDRVYEPIKPQAVTSNVGITNTIDLMNSLFGKYEKDKTGRKQASPKFEYPYSKRSKEFDDDSDQMSSVDRAFHASFKPKWTATGSSISTSNQASSSTEPWTWNYTSLASNGITLGRLVPEGSDPLTRLFALRSTFDVVLIDHVPMIQHKDLHFSDLVPGTNQPEVQILFELAHVLFDDYDDQFSSGLTGQQRSTFAARIKRDRLSAYLSTHLESQHAATIQEVQKRSPEEAAILCLSIKDVRTACQILIQAKDYNLAMLIAQIDQGDGDSQANIEAQINSWRKQQIISEMSDAIRTLYEISAGNTTFSQGDSAAVVEDRFADIDIAKRFGLDWLQSFGLHLWYGKLKNDSIAESIRDFASKIGSKEVPKPDINGRTSPLWILVALFAANTNPGHDSSLPEALDALSLPFDCRTTFQLFHNLRNRLPNVSVDTTKADQLAMDLAFQCSATGDYLGAIYPLMHLSDSKTRRACIKDVLFAHAASLPKPATEAEKIDRPAQFWFALIRGLEIPQQWIHEAKALYARSQNKSDDELHHLLAANLGQQAHECLCRRVAPRLVIDEDWPTLKATINGFNQGVIRSISDWEQGAGVYFDFCTLMSNTKQSPTKDLLKKLQLSLTTMGKRLKLRGSSLTAGGTEELEERVACNEMSAKVAERLTEIDGIASASAVLGLPLTADARLRSTRDMSAGYLRAALVEAR